MPNYDKDIALGIARKQLKNEDMTKWRDLNDVDYRHLLLNLNKQQKEFLYFANFIPCFALNENKTRTTVFFERRCWCGEKSHDKSSLSRFTEIFFHQLQNSPASLDVLLCAPTGKAAHNINGAKIHSPVCIPVGQDFKYNPLNMQQLNILGSKYMQSSLLMKFQWWDMSCLILWIQDCKR